MKKIVKMMFVIWGLLLLLSLVLAIIAGFVYGFDTVLPLWVNIIFSIIVLFGIPIGILAFIVYFKKIFNGVYEFIFNEKTSD